MTEREQRRARLLAKALAAPDPGTGFLAVRGNMLRRELYSPEREEIALRAEYYEIEIRRRKRRMVAAGIGLIFLGSWFVGIALGALL
jgi:hypothetical protein